MRSQRSLSDASACCAASPSLSDCSEFAALGDSVCDEPGSAGAAVWASAAGGTGAGATGAGAVPWSEEMGSGEVGAPCGAEVVAVSDGAGSGILAALVCDLTGCGLSVAPTSAGTGSGTAETVTRDASGAAALGCACWISFGRGLVRVVVACGLAVPLINAKFASPQATV